jgi:hypothetical protein
MLHEGGTNSTLEELDPFPARRLGCESAIRKRNGEERKMQSFRAVG